MKNNIVLSSSRKIRSMKKYLPIILSSLVVVIYLLITENPRLFVNYSYTRKGINVYSDKPIDTRIAQIIDTVDARLSCLDFSAKVKSRKVFIINNKLRFSIISNVSYQAFGVTTRISNCIIIAQSDIKNNVTAHIGGTNRTKLDEVITHEMVHLYINKHFGKLKTLFTKKWKVEGYCEYISKHSSFDTKKGLHLFVTKGENKTPSYAYFKYRMFVSYLIDKKKMKFEKIRETAFNVKDLENQIIVDIKNHSYSPKF